jgi:hypothetical protein
MLGNSTTKILIGKGLTLFPFQFVLNLYAPVEYII